MSVFFHNLMTLFIIQKKSVGNYRVPKHLLTRCLRFKPFFSNRSFFVAHAERIIKWTTLMPSWIYSSSNEKRNRQFKNFKWKILIGVFQILMIFHEFSLLNFLWSCRHFILFSKISPSGKIFPKISNFNFPKSGVFWKLSHKKHCQTYRRQEYRKN